jgi:hypothetical protein
MNTVKQPTTQADGRKKGMILNSIRNDSQVTVERSVCILVKNTIMSKVAILKIRTNKKTYFKKIVVE